MNMPICIGNWKSNKTVEESKSWINEFSTLLPRILPGNLPTIILCPPFTALMSVKEMIEEKSLPIVLAAQDISPFIGGAFTGEVSADMVKEFASFVLVGHAERRKYFKETEEELFFETLQAHKSDLSTVFCVPDADTVVSDLADIIAYEPVSAIGSGEAQSREKVTEICQKIHGKTGKPVLYGGSVSEETIQGFVRAPGISGVLIGKASLDPKQFFRLIELAADFSKS